MPSILARHVLKNSARQLGALVEASWDLSRHESHLHRSAPLGPYLGPQALGVSPTCLKSERCDGDENGFHGDVGGPSGTALECP